MSLSRSLCPCFETGIEKAVKEADEEVASYDNDEGEVGKASYSSALEYKEDEDQYYYTITVEMANVQ